MRFGILGPLEVADDGGRRLELRGRKQPSVLAILLLHANEVVSPDRLVEDLWSGRGPATAATSLQAHVSRLRRALGDDRRIVTTAGGYLIRVAPGELDRERFEGLVEEGDAAISTGDSELAFEKLREALSLWRGPPLSDFQYDSFAQAEIARLEELHVRAVEQRVEAELALGREGQVVGELERLVLGHPYRERLRGQLMLALYRTGRQAEALDAYRKARATLVEELGIEPSTELRELHDAVLAQDPSLLRPGARSLEQNKAETSERDQGASAVSEEVPEPREERKVVSVLVVKLAESAGGSARRDPEDLRALLAPYHARVRAEVGRFGGTVEKLIGGEAIAVFGAPMAHEDDPERAVRAALAIRDWAAEPNCPQVRIAVDTGEALIAIGSRSAPNGMMTAGDVVDTAARLQAAANTVLVGERTYRATRDSVEYHSAEDAATGGSSPLPAWEAVRAWSPGVSAAHSRTPLVGRVRELDLLVSTLTRVREEQVSQLVTLVGVPGIGKSRLVHELHEVAARGSEVIGWRQGRSLPYGDGVTFWALGEMVKAQAEILESDSLNEAADKLARAVRALMDIDADWIEAQLRPLVGLSPERGSTGDLSESSPAWRRFFEALAEERPTVLVFEDLHWADDGLLDFVNQIVDRAIDVPLLVLATARPELLDRRPDWGGGKRNALVLSLPPLIDDDAKRLIASMIDGPAIDAATLAELVGRAGGNPLYAEQYARAVLERGALEGLPESVQGIIAARLDALPDDAKRLLQDAAVVGTVFWLGSVEAIDGWSRSRAEEMLDGLARKEFLRPVRRSSVAGEPEYTFSHILLRDVAYGQIPRAARSEKHQRAAAWIESLGRSDDHAEMLAHHYLGALEYASAGRQDPTLVDSARLALRAAGDRALALASYTAAADFYGAALELWPETDPDRVWVLVRAGRAKFGSDRSGIDLFEAAVEELEPRGDADGAAQVAGELAHLLWIAGDTDASSAYCDRALELTSGRKHSRARAYALVERAANHMHASEHAKAIRVVRGALPLTAAFGMDELRVRALDVVGGCRVFSGDAEGLEDSKQAVALAREHNAFSRLIIAELNLHCLHYFLGQLAAAHEVLRTAQGDVETFGAVDQRRWFTIAKAHEDMLDGRWDEADRTVSGLIADIDTGAAPHYLDPAGLALRAMITLPRGALAAASADSEMALERARTTRDPQILAQALVVRAMVQLAQGRREDASSLAQELLARGSVLVIALLEMHLAATPIELAWLLRDLGTEAALHRVLASTPSNPWLEATSAIANGELADALQLVARIGAPSIEAYTQLRAGQDLTEAGQYAQAEPLLRNALAFYRSVDATRYIDHAEAALAARNQPSVRTPTIQ
jgi:DNA-binding SARP family transcriptional activator